MPPDDELSAEGGLSLAHPTGAGASGCRVLRAQAHPGQNCLQRCHQGDGQLHRDRHVAAPDQSSHRVPGLVPLSEGVRQEGPADRHRHHDQGQAQQDLGEPDWPQDSQGGAHQRPAPRPVLCGGLARGLH